MCNLLNSVFDNLAMLLVIESCGFTCCTTGYNCISTIFDLEVDNSSKLVKVY